MKLILLTRGLVAKVDDSMHEYLNQFSWHAKPGKVGNWYAERRCNFTRKLVKMHREVMNVTDSKVHVDHINGNGLDNTRVNLRLCSASENNLNRRKTANASTKFKGVCFCKRDGLYFAYISVYGKRKYLGYSKTDPEMLARLYDKEAVKLHGQFARTNFPQTKE